MKEFNADEYNKMCAEFTGWVLTDNDLICHSVVNGRALTETFKGYIRQEQPYVKGVSLFAVMNNIKHIEYYTEKEMNFTDDWKLIMSVVEKIEKNYAWVNIKGCAVDITNKISVSKPTKKEAVVQAIWEFFNIYCQNYFGETI
jgi:hypothetical protein